MKYETIKSFILTVLVGISLFLSYILWSYHPNYESFYDTSYINEVNVGGTEKTKNELVEPIEIIFQNEGKITSFTNPSERRSFYKDLASWVLYDYRITDSNGRPEEEKKYIELVFPSAVPADLIINLFTFHEDIDPPNWSFERVFLVLDENEHIVELVVLSVDDRKQITAKIEKMEAYDELSASFDSEELADYISFGSANEPIYLPKERLKMSSKTLIASSIEPEQFINALFSNPSLVTPNTREAYFTDGQRGMEVVHDKRKLEFINPIQSSFEILDSYELLDRSVNNINEHKGWTNDFIFEEMNNSSNYIRFRLYYEGFPVFDHYNISIIEQEWREQELYQYARPLVQIGNLLNSEEIELPSGQEVSSLLEKSQRIDVENIDDIQVGYALTYIDDAHSLTLEPNWYIFQQGEWIKFNLEDDEQELQAEGGD